MKQSHRRSPSARTLAAIFAAALVLIAQAPMPSSDVGVVSLSDPSIDELQSSGILTPDDWFGVSGFMPRAAKVLEQTQPPAVPAPPQRWAYQASQSAPSGQQADESSRFVPSNQPPDIRTDEPSQLSKSSRGTSHFNQGFRWATEDGEFDLNLHAEMQVDSRTYVQPDSDPVPQFGMYMQRARVIFSGHLTEPIEYAISFNRGLGSLDLLDAYVNVNYDPRMQFRLGRFRMPFTYDFYSLTNQYLLTPERSVFALNYGYNRNVAAMMHGELLDNSVDYAVALAAGPRNSFQDSNASKDVAAYLNLRPFKDVAGWEFFDHLNVGGSVAYGIQDQNPMPIDFRTSLNATTNSGALDAVPAFLQLNSNVMENGLRQLQELHLAWYYNSLTVQSAWDTGYNDYSINGVPGHVRLPVQAWHVQCGYFLTGEHLQRRSFVEPLRPFDLRAGKRGPGAWEVQARFDDFHVGHEVFSGGLADEAKWTNHVRTIDAGVNWYLNAYVKVYLDWQHQIFASPVAFRPVGGLQSTSDLLLTRLQVSF